jgi:hypothetical protein
MDLKAYLFASFCAAVGLIPWLLDKAGVTVSRFWVSTRGCIVILALASGLFHPVAWLLRQIGFSGEVRRASAASMTVLFLLGGLASVWWLGIWTVGTPTIGPRTTSLRLQFNAGNNLPDQIDQQNIWRWYALPIGLDAADKSGKTVARVGRPWVIYVQFDKPTTVRGFKIDAGGAKLPPHEVKDYSPRHAVLVFADDLAGLVLTVLVLN